MKACSAAPPHRPLLAAPAPLLRHLPHITVATRYPPFNVMLQRVIQIICTHFDDTHRALSVWHAFAFSSFRNGTLMKRYLWLCCGVVVAVVGVVFQFPLIHMGLAQLNSCISFEWRTIDLQFCVHIYFSIVRSAFRIP